MKSKIITLLYLLLDSLIIISSIYLVWFFDNNNFNIPNIYFVLMVFTLACYQIFSFIFSLNNIEWKYASIKELLSIFYTITLTVASAGILTIIALKIFKLVNFIKIIELFQIWLILLVFIGASKMLIRIKGKSKTDTSDFERILIFGAGRGGTLLARQMENTPLMKMKPLIFLDDDPYKIKKIINGIKVYGDRSKLESAINKYDIEKVVIAIPSLASNKLKELYEVCNEYNIVVQIMPNIDDVLTGKKEVSNLKNIALEDLLGRSPVELDSTGIGEVLNNKTVLITGAGGSIGSEITRQISKFGPKKVILLGHGENSIYLIHQEMKTNINNVNIDFIPIIADIQDRNRIFSIFEEYKPQIVYHAAAHKHVPLMEINPKEAIKNNIFGTKNVAEASHKYGVDSFVMISTDKAVNPPNIMGGTKRWAEMIVQNMAYFSDTKFVAVRFGNVLGSRGSVIPLFKKQIANGGPITVTHPEITRYFMTIPEASRLVIQAGALAKGGEVFVLDMGEPVKIVDLAKNVIKLSGYSIDDIGITFTGLRPGEKMYEELLNKNEVSEIQVHEKIYVGKAAPKNYDCLLKDIECLLSLSSEEAKDLIISEANKKFV